VLECSREGDVLTVKTQMGDMEMTNEFTFGEDCTTSVAGFECTMNVQETDTGYTGTVAFGDKEGTSTTEVTDDGLLQTITIGDVVTKRHYTRM